MSKAGLNFTWGPPSPSVLNFSNSSCSQIASITAYRRSIDADIFDSWLESAKYNDKRRTVELVELIRQGLQSYFDEKGLNGSFSADIEDWVFADKNVWNKAIQFALYNCKNELCQQVGWAGNADIVGRGMLVTYVLQTILTTIYVLALLILYYKPTWAMPQRNPVVSRFFAAIQHSTSEFMKASAVFSISMLFAAMIYIAQRYQESAGTATAFVLSILMPYASVFPVVLLQLSGFRMFRRKQGRLVLWVLIALLVTVIQVMGIVFYYGVKSKEFDDVSDQDSWERYCIDRNPLRATSYLLMALGGVLILGIWGYLSGSLAMKLERFKKPQWWLAHAEKFWLAGLMSSLVLMFLCLAWFIHLQHSTSDIGGEDNKDKEWSFGQILAVATWFPVMVEFGYVLCERPREAINGRLIEPFEVRETSQRCESMEALRRGTFEEVQMTRRQS